MNLDGVQSAATQARMSAARKTDDAAEGMGSDFETFLTLLTAQMRNQDPLNPMDSTAFVAQLAEFSGVEQQVKSNETLGAILDALSGGGAGDLAQLVGKEVAVEGPAQFTGEPVEVAFDPDPAAVSAQLVVRDASGEIVAHLPADPAATSAIWDGALDEGAAGDGAYTISQARLGADGLVEEVAGRVYARVAELRLTADGPRLALEGGAMIEESAVSAIRD